MFSKEDDISLGRTSKMVPKWEVSVRAEEAGILGKGDKYEKGLCWGGMSGMSKRNTREPLMLSELGTGESAF